MERLVMRVGTTESVPTQFNIGFILDMDKDTFNELQKIFNQLCDLTDILGDDYSIDRIRELVEANRNGQYVILPCKVGDTVYSVREDFYNKKKRKGIQTGKVKGFEFSCANSIMWVHFEDDTPTSSIAFHLSEIGKTVFHTKQDAETALKTMKEE